MLDFTNIFHLLFAVSAVLILNLHWCTHFLHHKGAGVYTALDIVLHIALLSCMALGGMTLDFAFMVFMISVFFYTLIGAVNYIITDKKEESDEGGESV